ncbi:MAG: hypothetical protein ACKO8U_18230 [Pirellula sp.]
MPRWHITHPITSQNNTYARHRIVDRSESITYPSEIPRLNFRAPKLQENALASKHSGFLPILGCKPVVTG